MRDASNNPVPGARVTFRVLSGDGLFSSDTVTNVSGVATFSYAFTGSLGQAVVEATHEDDTLTFVLRAPVLIPGNNGQGDLILFSDRYADVKTWKGNPAGTVPLSGRAYNLALYDQAEGLVVMVWDVNSNSQIEDTEPVRGVLATAYDTPNAYVHPTLDSLQVDVSPYRDVEAVYGPPDRAFLDLTDPAVPAFEFQWDAVGLVVFTDTLGDSTVRQIDVFELTAPGGIAKPHQP